MGASQRMQPVGDRLDAVLKRVGVAQALRRDRNYRRQRILYTMMQFFEQQTLQLFSGVGSLANTAETGGVAYMAHIGGFVAGFVLTFLFRGSRGALSGS